MDKKPFVLTNFSFRFQHESPLFFDSISIDVEKPGLIFIVGKNGIGKSTFLRCIQGITQYPEELSGMVSLQNKQYNLANESDRNLLYQDSRALSQNFDSMLALPFTGLENLQFSNFTTYPSLSCIKKNHEQYASIEKLYTIPLHKPVKFLSGGQRQMLALLMVTQKPISLLLLDEPTAALDDKNSRYVMDGLKTLSKTKQMSIICISHDMDLIHTYADSIITMKEPSEGKKVFEVL